MRNDRYVLPVKAEYKHQFGGTVHDHLHRADHIETQAVMELNNKRAELQRAERQEIERGFLMASVRGPRALSAKNSSAMR